MTNPSKTIEELRAERVFGRRRDPAAETIPDRAAVEKPTAPSPETRRRTNRAKPRSDARAAAKERAAFIARRFETANRFADHHQTDLDPAAALTWWTLLRHTGADGTASVAQARLAKQTGYTDKSIKRAVSDLKRRGLLAIVHQGGKNRGLSVYRILAPVPNDEAEGDIHDP